MCNFIYVLNFPFFSKETMLMLLGDPVDSRWGVNPSLALESMGLIILNSSIVPSCPCRVRPPTQPARVLFQSPPSSVGLRPYSLSLVSGPKPVTVILFSPRVYRVSSGAFTYEKLTYSSIYLLTFDISHTTPSLSLLTSYWWSYDQTQWPFCHPSDSLLPSLFSLVLLFLTVFKSGHPHSQVSPEDPSGSLTLTLPHHNTIPLLVLHLPSPSLFVNTPVEEHDGLRQGYRWCRSYWDLTSTVTSMFRWRFFTVLSVIDRVQQCSR